MKPSRIVLLFGVVLAAALFSVSTAGADDVSGQAWANGSDATVAGVVQTPSASQYWGGMDLGADNIYNLADQDPYNYVKVGAVESAIERAGEDAGGFVNPWGFVTSVAISTVGTYIAYEARSWWFKWLDSEWGSVAPSTNLCGGANANGSNWCELVPVQAGAAYCIGFTWSGYPVSWTAPSDGLLLETSNSAYQSRSFAGGCSTGYSPVALLQTDTAKIADVESEYNVGFETNSGQPTTNPLTIWFEAAPGLLGVAHTPPPSNPQPTAVEGYVGGASQPTPNGNLTSHTTIPTTAQWANALRRELTDPSDTCNGLPCSWGNNGGAPGANQTHVNSNEFTCVITGTCLKTGLPCTYHTNVYILYDRQAPYPTYPGVTPKPNGCWRWQDLRGKNLGLWTNCSVLDYPAMTTSGIGPLHSYDDTNPNHTDDSSSILNGCLNGAITTLALEFEAPGASPGTCNPGWVGVIPPGVTVQNFLLETYCHGNDGRDDPGLVSDLSYTSNTGGVINVGADIPIGEGGPCSPSTDDCLGNLTSDVLAVCDYTPSGGILGLYEDYLTPKQADSYTETVNSALNSCEY